MSESTKEYIELIQNIVLSFIFIAITVMLIWFFAYHKSGPMPIGNDGEVIEDGSMWL